MMECRDCTVAVRTPHDAPTKSAREDRTDETEGGAHRMQTSTRLRRTLDESMVRWKTLPVSGKYLKNLSEIIKFIIFHLDS